MPSLLTAVWGPRWGDFNNLSLNQKWADMAVAAGSAHAAMTGLAHNMQLVNPTFLFVAPEYYFVRGADHEPLTEQEGQTAEGAVRSLSASLDRMILVPGTINYKKKRGKFARWRSSSRHSDRSHSVHSVSPIFYAGTTLKRYYKRMNDNTYDGDHPEHDCYFVGGTHPGTFSRNGIRFGIDICGDYSEKRLVGDVPTRDLDVHIYSSGTNSHDFNDPTSIAARNGGYFVHSDCNDSGRTHQHRNGVWAVSRGGGLHGGSSGESLKQAVSADTLSHPALANKTHGQKVTMKLNSVIQQRSNTRNVTRQAPLKVPIYVAGLEIFTCPL